MAPSSKPCTFSGCDGVMTVDDRPWASYVTWICNLNRAHAQVLYKEGTPCKPCSRNDCNGMMRFHSRHRPLDDEEPWEWPWYCTWVCERDAAHIQVIPKADVRQMVRSGVIPRAWG
jgi:hypothetical protein